MRKLTCLQVQAALIFLGYNPGTTDGFDGPRTKAALMQFARDYALSTQPVDVQEASLVAAISGSIQPKKDPEQPAQSAAVSLEQYMQADGFYHIPKGINIPVSEHFRSGEFDCRCKRPGCKWTIIHPKLLIACEDLRADVGGRPLTITDSGGSGYRCPAHNADPDVGGSPNSLHTLGLAADIHCIGVSSAQMAAAAELRYNYGEIGVYSDYIHLGVFRPDGAHTRW